MNNLRDFTKICRVCMSDGSRDIFHKIAPSPIPSTSNANNCTSTSPLDRLLEKLRYVTMMKIEENDDLPRLLCDLCIVQLNVAYNFKRQAVENDTKLRQYFIENGISSAPTGLSSSSSASASISFNKNNNSSNCNSSNLILNDNQNVRNPLTNTNAATPSVNRSFPIVPFIIKTEPMIDNDALSDVTTEINLTDPNRIEHLTPSTIRTSTPGREIQMNTNCNRNSNSIDVFNKDKNNSSVVYINGYGYNTLTPSSDIESVHNNYQNLQSQQQQQQQLQQIHCLQLQHNEVNTQENQNNPSKNNNRSVISVENIKNNNRNISELMTKNTVKNSISSTSSSPLRQKVKRTPNELKNLSINMNLPSGKRNRTLDTTKENTTNQLQKQKSSTTPLISVSDKISTKKKLTVKLSNNNNNRKNSNVNNKKRKPTKAQQEFLKDIGKVINNTIVMKEKLPSSSSSLSSSSSSMEHHKLFINPLCNNSSNDNCNEEQSKLKKKRLYNEGRIKERTLTKFIRPKLEPTEFKLN